MQDVGKVTGSRRKRPESQQSEALSITSSSTAEELNDFFTVPGAVRPDDRRVALIR